MTEEKKTEELLKVEFKASKFLTAYSGNGKNAADGDVIETTPALAEKLLYNLPENMIMVSKGKVAEDVVLKAKAHLANRYKRQRAAKKIEDDKLAKLKAEQNKAFSK